MRALLFDFGGTLDCPRHWLDRFVEHYHAAGLKLSRAELDAAFTSATLAGYRAGQSIWDYDLRELIAFLVDKQFGFLNERKSKDFRFSGELNDRSLVEEMKQRISDRFVAESEAGLARSRVVVSSLAQGFTIGVVSNFYGDLERILDDAGFGDAITAIADSGRLGVHKPEAKIYETALAMIGMEARATVMIGDSIDKDCVPARRLGMSTIWVRHPQAAVSKPLAADSTIDALEELQELLWRMG